MNKLKLLLIGDAMLGCDFRRLEMLNAPNSHAQGEAVEGDQRKGGQKGISIPRHGPSHRNFLVMDVGCEGQKKG